MDAGDIHFNIHEETLMTTQQIVNVNTDTTPEQLAHWRAQLSQQAPDAAPVHGKHTVAHKAEVVMQGGRTVHEAQQHKTQGYNEAYVNQPKPGFVTIGGVETSVAAAKSAGLLPSHWQEGQPVPFADPAAAPSGTKAGTADVDANKPPETDTKTANQTHAEHLAKLAGDILHGVDQVHGPGVADGLLGEVAESGDLDSVLDRLPQGVQETHAKQVLAGYRASADHAFAKAGSSLAAVEELLTEDELRDARRFTLANNPEALADLGRVAVERLAQLPEAEARAWINELPAKERGYFSFKTDRGITFKAPGAPEMSWGAAVRAGFIKV